MKLLKSVLAILTGFMTVLILSVITDMILEAVGFFPPVSQPGAYTWWLLLIALIYRCVFTVAGGYVTATLAPAPKMRHVLILAGIGFIVGTLGSIANWSNAVLQGVWYPIALVVLSVPSVWLGGKLKIDSK